VIVAPERCSCGWPSRNLHINQTGGLPLYLSRVGGGHSRLLACRAASVESCLAHLHGDLRFYTSAMYADDVRQVLKDLHYTKANFTGISYGTAAEQVFLLRHPGQLRTLTMQSGSPLTVPVYERAPGNFQLALDRVFARCQSQPAWHRAFQHLSADWARLWASIRKSPLVLPASNRHPSHRAHQPGSVRRHGEQRAVHRQHQPDPDGALF
jgi:pimeloyl-ACP methyl ester carboxylesterase